MGAIVQGSDSTSRCSRPGFDLWLDMRQIKHFGYLEATTALGVGLLKF